MERLRKTVIGLTVVVGLSALGADAPSTQPALAPSTQPTMDRLARGQTGFGQSKSRESRTSRHSHSKSGTLSVSANDPYAVLRERSIFVKGNQAITVDSSPSRQTGDSGLANHPGSALVFNGVIVVGDEANAMIEDTGSGRVSLMKVGDLIAAGKVSAITFDDLTYEVNGQEKHVSLGQNMDGVVPSSSAPVITGATSSSGGGSTADGTGGGVAGGTGGSGTTAAPSSGSGGSSAEDILARMRAKRNQELGIK